MFKIGDRLQFINNKDEKVISLGSFLLKDIVFVKYKSVNNSNSIFNTPARLLEYDDIYYRGIKIKKIKETMKPKNELQQKFDDFLKVEKRISKMKKLDKTKISRRLSYILRHDPGEIFMDPFGWVYIEDLCEDLGISKQDIIDIVDTNDKKRFILSDDGLKIRCVQGHTINVKLELKEDVPPTVLYHGTSPKYVKMIKDSGGLSRMSRHHVHLSEDKETAIDVGQRHSKHEKPIILEIDSEKMYNDGYKFFVSENGVWLTNEVPNKYIKY